MAEKTDVIREVLANPRFTERVRAICATKAHTILGQEAPDAAQLAWAKVVVAPAFNAWTESLLMLVEAGLETAAAAYAATDVEYAAVLDAALPEILKARA